MGIGVGVIGAGTVGGGVVHTLLNNRDIIEGRAQRDIALVHVAERNQAALAEFDLTGVAVSGDASDLIADPNVDVVCELIGGLEPARSIILEALNAGKHVVTANKMLLAHHGPELARAAAGNGVDLRYEAAVCGGIPVIKALREGLSANRIEYVYGILNGTCNYILTRMTYEGLEFDAVLQEAIENGFAESPPDLDIQGHDTAHKCQIMASLCFATEINHEDIHVEGVTRITHADVAYAAEMGYLIKLLAIIRDEGDEVDARVHPTLVREGHLLAQVRDEFNAVYVQADTADATLYFGRGAGRFATASAVVADIADIARRNGATPPPPFIYGERKPVRDMGRITGRYYLRLTTVDRPGVLGTVCTVLGNHGVSIASCIQKEEHENRPVHVVLMTHDTEEAPLATAIQELDALDFIREPTHMIRVLWE
jgi:homoserine dehydrogenase